MDTKYFCSISNEESVQNVPFIANLCAIHFTTQTNMSDFNVCSSNFLWSRDSSVGIVITLPVGWPRNRGLIPSRSKSFPSSP
jgi:hypothetical protein